MEEIKMTHVRSSTTERETMDHSKGHTHAIFSKLVFPPVVTSLMETRIFTVDHDMSSADEDEMCKQEIDTWLQYKKASTKKSRLKKIVRRRLPATVRKRLWQEASSGSTFMSRSPELYHELCDKLFGKDNAIPGEIPSCPLIVDTQFMSYYLTSDGVLILRKLLYVLSYLHPEVTYSPLLEAVAAIFLHFMEEVWCFACLSSMLSAGSMFFDRNHIEVSVSAAGFQDCVRLSMKPVFKRLSSFVMEENPEENKQIIFPTWKRMIFEHLDFMLLVRIVDCLLVEGQKVLYRSGMVLLQIFYEYSLAYEKIGCPTAHDLCLAIGQHSEILTIDPDNFIKASLKIKLKTKAIIKAREVNSTIKSVSEDPEQKERANSLVLSIDVRELSDIITTQQWRKLIGWLPLRIQLLQPHLVFSTQTDGYSLRTLYVKAEEEEQCLILIRSDKDEVFGAYISEPLEKRKGGRKNLTFFGTGETFLFTMKPNTIPFKWVGIETAVDGPLGETPKRKTSYVFVEYKDGNREKSRRRSSVKRAVQRFSRASYRVPHSFSSKDFRDTEQTYGGIRKNQSVTCLKDMPDVFDSPLTRTTPTGPRRKERVHGNEMEMVHGNEMEMVRVPKFEVGNDGTHSSLAHELIIEEREIPIDETDNPDELIPNDLFIACDDGNFIVGGGGGYGLWIDRNLDYGRSETCGTFRNHRLVANETGDFRCARVEVFGFRN